LADGFRRRGCRALVEGAHGVSEVLRREVLIPESHPWVAMAEERHHGPLCDAGHRQRARRVVSEVVKREVRKLEGVHKAPKGDRKRSRIKPSTSRAEPEWTGITRELLRQEDPVRG